MVNLDWQRRKVQRRLKRVLFSRIFRDDAGDSGRAILVAGTARSGTTWLADIIQTQLSCRVMFEPFQARLVGGYRQFNYFQYMRPEEENGDLAAFCRRVFAGEIRHRWIDREVDQLRPSCRLVKEIRANLMLKWMRERFPEVPQLFIVRHPCAVVASRMQLGWDTDGDLNPLLGQKHLVEDFLADKLDLIHAAGTPEEKHALIWSITNLVPLRQFKKGELTVVYYEDLCLHPAEVVPQIFGAIGRPFDESVWEATGRPSFTSRSGSAAVTGDNRLTQWQKLLTASQVERVRGVVDAFGLDRLYGDSLTPLGSKILR